jgi:hypothetical protein
MGLLRFNLENDNAEQVENGIQLHVIGDRTRFSPETVALVLASTHYDKSRSLRSWEDYLEAIAC